MATVPERRARPGGRPPAPRRPLRPARPCRPSSASAATVCGSDLAHLPVVDRAPEHAGDRDQEGEEQEQEQRQRPAPTPCSLRVRSARQAALERHLDGRDASALAVENVRSVIVIRALSGVVTSSCPGVEALGQLVDVVEPRSDVDLAARS